MQTAVNDTPVYWWVAFNAFILVMLALDLGVFHRKAHSAWKIDGMVSLGVITGILAITVIASIIHRKNALRN